MRSAILVGLLGALALVGCGRQDAERLAVVGTWILREDPPATGYAELALAADGTYQGTDARSGPDATRSAPPTVARGVWTLAGPYVHTTARSRNGEAVGPNDRAYGVTLVRRGDTLRPRAADGSLGPPFRRK